jgi:hypothetical protein
MAAISRARSGSWIFVLLWTATLDLWQSTIRFTMASGDQVFRVMHEMYQTLPGFRYSVQQAAALTDHSGTKHAVDTATSSTQDSHSYQTPTRPSGNGQQSMSDGNRFSSTAEAYMRGQYLPHPPHPPYHLVGHATPPSLCQVNSSDLRTPSVCTPATQYLAAHTLGSQGTASEYGTPLHLVAATSAINTPIMNHQLKEAEIRYHSQLAHQQYIQRSKVQAKVFERLNSQYLHVPDDGFQPVMPLSLAASGGAQDAPRVEYDRDVQPASRGCATNGGTAICSTQAQYQQNMHENRIAAKPPQRAQMATLYRDRSSEPPTHAQLPDTAAFARQVESHANMISPRTFAPVLDAARLDSTSAFTLNKIHRRISGRLGYSKHTLPNPAHAQRLLFDDEAIKRPVMQLRAQVSLLRTNVLELPTNCWVGS